MIYFILAPPKKGAPLPYISILYSLLFNLNKYRIIVPNAIRNTKIFLISTDGQ